MAADHAVEGPRAARLSAMHSRQIEMLKQTPVTQADFSAVVLTLRRLERFWMNTGDLTTGSPQFAA